MLNGEAIRLGTVSDVVDKVHGRQTIEIGVEDNDRTYSWTFAGERSEMSMAVDRVAIDNESYNQPGTLRHLLPDNGDVRAISLAKRLRGLTYITAERVGPREVYSLDDRQSSMVVGAAGENTASVLHWGRDEHVIEKLALPEVPTTRLRQIEERMRVFFPKFTMEVQHVQRANAVTLGLRTSDETDFHRPIHAGFGLTQVLPIVVASLSATENDILLIENPEVHLHPGGQNIMGQFLADVARAGVQVIVETHSDHVLNGIRRSVKADRLKPEKVAVHFFKNRSTETAQVLSPQLDGSGNIDNWPEGFFDQYDKDASHFAGWGE
jgi:predicted ATPase